MLFGQIGAFAEIIFGILGEGSMLREPEDGENDLWQSAGFGGDGVGLVEDGDAAAGIVDVVVVGHGQAAGGFIAVVEFEKGLMVDDKVFHRADNDFAHVGGVDKVAEVDYLAGGGVDMDIVARVFFPLGEVGIRLDVDLEDVEAAVGDVVAV